MRWPVKLAALAVLLGMFLTGASSGEPEGYGGITDGGALVYAAPARLSKAALRAALDHCMSEPELGKSPRFASLLKGTADPVELSGEDVKMLYLCDGTSETARETRSQCAQGNWNVFLMETQGGFPLYSASTSPAPPQREALILEYLGWVGSNVDSLVREDDLAWICSLSGSGEDPLCLLARAMGGGTSDTDGAK